MEIELQHVTKRFGDITAVNDVSLSIDDGEFVTLVGPSGCGKTTTLRMIAGLETVTEGSVLFGGRDVTEQSAKERDIAFVFQNYALYPHMTARRNMTFALEDEGRLTSDEIERKVEETAEMLGIEEHLDQKPNELSGGQQQRVALGRSIVRDPEVFLLDEPLSNLDAKLRTQMRAELQKLHDELDTTMVYVTHDQEEAMTMSDRVVVMDSGQIQQVGAPATVYNQPTNRFVAQFIGNPSMNFFDAEVRDSVVRGNQFTFEPPVSVEGDIAEFGVRPEDLEITSDGDFVGEVRVFEQVGSFNMVYVASEGREEDVAVQVSAQETYETGEEVRLGLDEDRVHLFAADGTALTSSMHRTEDTVPAGN